MSDHPPVSPYGPAATTPTPTSDPSIPPYAQPYAQPQSPASPAGGQPPPWMQPSPYVTPSPTAPRIPRDARPATLAIVAMVAAIFGAVLACVPAAVGSSWPLLLFALVLAIVALAGSKHGGKGRAVGALLIALFGLLIAVIVSVVASFSGYGGDADSEPPYEETRIGPPQPGSPFDMNATGQGSVDLRHVYGDTTSIIDLETDQKVWTANVGVPVDLTDALTADALVNPAPESGTYIGVPVTVTYLGDGIFDPMYDYDWTLDARWEPTPGGEDARYTAPVMLADGEVNLQVLPTMASGDTVETYAVFDAPLTDAGAFVLSVGFLSDSYWASTMQIPAG